MASIEQGHLIGYLPRGYDDLPEAVLEHICSYLNVSGVLQSLQVCSAWNAVIENLVNKTQFWFTRFHQIGLGISQEHKLVLQEFPDDNIRLLKSAYLNKDNIDSRLQKCWRIDEGNLQEAVFQLISSHTPASLILTLTSNPTITLEIFLKLIQSKVCHVSIKDSSNWRGLSKSSSWLLERINACYKYKVANLSAAVTSIAELPTTLTMLMLGLVMDTTTQKLIDPGLRDLKERCPSLRTLGIHARAGYSTAHLPSLPNMNAWLFLSHLSTDEDVMWAARTAKRLQPPGGWPEILLPECGLSGPQLEHLFVALRDSQVKIYSLALSGHQFSLEEQQRLSHESRAALLDLHFGLNWRVDEHMTEW